MSSIYYMYNRSIYWPDCWSCCSRGKDMRGLGLRWPGAAEGAGSVGSCREAADEELEEGGFSAKWSDAKGAAGGEAVPVWGEGGTVRVSGPASCISCHLKHKSISKS